MSEKNSCADFEVFYRFLSKEEGGREKGIAFQGYRSDWLYDGDDPQKNGTYMIHPEFIDETGKPFEQNIFVPKEGTARMRIINTEMKSYHQSRIKKGVKGYFVEGARKIAEATVTKILYTA